MKRINELTLLTALRSADEIIVRNSATGETSRTTLATLLNVFGGVVESTDQLLWGHVSADSVGTRITFDRPFANANYAFFPFSQNGDTVVTVSIGTVAGGTKAAGYIDVFPTSDNAVVGWFAIGEKAT